MTAQRIEVDGVPYVRADLWPVDVSDGVHVSGVTWGLSACVAAIVTAMDAGGNCFAQLLLPPHFAPIDWAGTYSYDFSGVRSFGWHRPTECPRRPYR